MQSNKMLSLILLSYNSSKAIIKIFEHFQEALNTYNIPFEFIIIDDGSTDDSNDISKQLCLKNSKVRHFELSKNYTSPYAQFAGLKVCHGDCAVFIADDFQRPVENVIASYRKWEAGHKIVISGRKSRKDGLFSDFFSSAYYKMMNSFSDIQFPKGGADGFLADREIIDLINQHISPINTSPIIEVLRLGFKPYILEFDRPKSERKSRWTFTKKVKLAKNNFFSSTSFPIRLITWIGFFFFVFSIVLIFGLIVGKLFTNNTLFGYPIPGWTSTMILVAFFNGITLFSLGIVAEYIYRIFEEVKGRPAFIIKEKKSD